MTGFVGSGEPKQRIAPNSAIERREVGPTTSASLGHGKHPKPATANPNSEESTQPSPRNRVRGLHRQGKSKHAWSTRP